jgi:aquaporin TIP
MRPAVAEMAATFAFVFVGAGAAIASGFGIDLTGVALAHGLALAVAVWLTPGGGGVNPAVTLALWVSGRVDALRAGAFVAAQLVGAFVAALLLRYLVPGTAFDAGSGGTPAVASGIAPGKAVVIEAVCTFLLVAAVFGVSTRYRARAGEAAGLAPGVAAASVATFAFLGFGAFTGAAINPARWFGPALASGIWDDWYVWIVGPISGAIIAAVVASTIFEADRANVRT